MNSTPVITSINVRYSSLSGTECCLSCGSALTYAAVKPGYRCLDLGSGRGADVIRMADKAGKNGFVYGIDISDGMIARARSTAEKLGVRNVSFIQSPLETIPLESDSIDVVLSNCTINHGADKLTIWKEIFRVLKTGGKFVISDIYSTAHVPEKYRTDPEAVAECWAGSVTRDEYLTTLRSAGFSEISIHEESAPYPKGEIEVASWTIEGEKKA